MSDGVREHEVSRVVQATGEEVFAVVSDVGRLPDWLPVVQAASTLPDGEVHVEGDLGSGKRAGAGSHQAEGFWRVRPEQRRVEWSTPSRDARPEAYAGWLQVEDRTQGCEVVVHLSFLAEHAPADVDQALAAALESLADLVER